MATGRLLRAELTNTGPTEVARGRLLRAEASVGVPTVARGRLLRAEVSAASTAAQRGRLLRAEAVVSPTVVVPSVVTGTGMGTVTMTATLSIGSSSQWQWEQIGGNPVTMNGDGASRSFTPKAATTAQELTFRVRALVDGTWTAWRTVVASIALHPVWTLTNGDLVPLVRSSEPAPPEGDPTEGLFFELPANIRTYGKKLFAHYFTPYTISQENADPASDYYQRNFLNPTGESNRKLASGGLLRDRPLPSQPKSDYLKQNARTEIGWAIAAGIDGFFVDLLGPVLTGQNWDRGIALRDAAIQYYPGFYVIPMIDTNGAYGTSATPAQNAQAINAFAGRASSYYTPEGRFLVGSFKAEGKDQAWWQSVFAATKSTYNIDVTFAAVFNNFGLSTSYLGVTDIASTFGMGSDPGVIAGYSNNAATARSRGDKWMMPVTPQNVRPNQFWFDEAWGTGALRASWARAVKDDADYIQLVTWSDFSEGTQSVPSQASGFVTLDLCAYYQVKWKTGALPPILRDAMYLSHRNQVTSTTPAFPSTSPMTQRSQSNMTPAKNDVEILTFFLASTQVEVHIGPNAYTYTAPAGEYVQRYPLAIGKIYATARRSSAVVAYVGSAIGCLPNPPVQDRQYFRFSSLRPTTGYKTPSNLDGMGIAYDTADPAPLTAP